MTTISAGEKAVADTRADFRKLLCRLFQRDCADLDFGIYRVMNLKKDVIDEMIRGVDDLIDDSLGGEKAKTRARNKQQLADTAEQVRKNLSHNALDSAGNLRQEWHNSAIGKKYLAAQKKAQATLATTETETDLLNHLLRFFGRYYDEGDFMPRRRTAKRGCYALPHNGEDVLLHWANRGQYYIKSALQFSVYAFAAGNTRAQFVVRAAQTPSDNNKGGKRFFFPQMAEVVLKDGQMQIPLEYRPAIEDDNLQTKTPQAEIITRAVEDTKAIIAKDKNPQLAALVQPQESEDDSPPHSPLQKHLQNYARGNERDFFVHKNLGAFLSRELDFYIKNEAVDIAALAEDTDIMRQLLMARVLKTTGGKIIDILAQFEDFQKTLWQKRKFITETNYIVRLGAIDKKARADMDKLIVECDKQWLEWQKLNLLVDDKKLVGKAADNKSRLAFLASTPSLPLDSAHFNDEFKSQLLGTFAEGIDDNTDGVLLHGDNYQVLNLIAEKYRAKVKCVYIDPPYNTDQSKIMYKNDLEHSSWLTMMENRLALTNAFLNDDSVVMTAIDDYELNYLCELMQVCFANCEQHVIVINHHPQGAGMGGAKLSRTHEYMIIATAPNAPQLKGGHIAERIERLSFRRAGQGENNFRGDFSNSFFAVLVDENKKVMGLESPPEGNGYPRDNTPEGYRRIYPIGEDGSERVWRRAHETTEKIVATGMLECTDRFVIRLIIDHGENRRAALFSNWTNKTYNAGTWGANLLSDIIGSSGAFSYPKSLYTVRDAIDSCTWDDNNAIIMDYFAGSGTTAHAVINLNREDGGRRKFILAEMGDHFDTVLLPRIKKLIFAAQWKDGKPANNGNMLADNKGEVRLIKYQRIESYEDALDNIHFDEDAALLGKDKRHKNYLARYMLQWESKECATFANNEHLQNPFDYTLQRANKNQQQQPLMRADLPETFNYLAGMHLQTRRYAKNNNITKGNPNNYQLDYGTIKGKPTLIIWRNTQNWKQADYDADSKFISTLIAASPETQTPRQIYTNGTSTNKNAKSLIPLFQKQMFASDD